LVDEDDGQKEGSFERVMGLVYCGNDNINNKKSLNELLLEGGYAVIYQDFCGISEFSSATWLKVVGSKERSVSPISENLLPFSPDVIVSNLHGPVLCRQQFTNDRHQ
jgi:hypothetical protein